MLTRICNCDNLIKIIKNDLSFYKKVIQINKETTDKKFKLSKIPETGDVLLSRDSEEKSFLQGQVVDLLLTIFLTQFMRSLLAKIYF